MTVLSVEGNKRMCGCEIKGVSVDVCLNRQ
jgi:hypothetical protein